MTALTHARLLQVLDYSIVTGRFYWRKRISIRIKAVGARAGFDSGHGYWYLTIDGQKYGAHRLAWFYVTGTWPDEDIDHEDGRGQNNAWHNLRALTHRANTQNIRAPHRDNQTGFLGVSRNRKRFSAHIYAEGHRRTLGTFDTPEEAHAVYLAAKRQLHEGCTL